MQNSPNPLHYLEGNTIVITDFSSYHLSLIPALTHKPKNKIFKYMHIYPSYVSVSWEISTAREQF